MKRHFFIILIGLMTAGLITGCGISNKEQKEKTRMAAAEMRRIDSLAFKMAVTPTLDCLPVFVAKECHFFDTLGVQVHLKPMNAQMDIDEALRKGQVECGVTDVMRAERMIKKGVPLSYLTSTNAYWQLFSNKKSRIKELRQLGDKMIAMTRYSATDYLATMALDSVKPDNPVFRIQINDVTIRLKMLQNNEMDAVLLPEPQATTARIENHPIHMDSRGRDLRLGAVVVRNTVYTDEHRKKQLDAFKIAYDQACDSINQYGLRHYTGIIKQYCQTDDRTVAALPKLTFSHITPPREKDINKTKNVKWRTH